MIRTENLFFSYEGLPVLENVNIEIKEGEYVGVIGPNGGGKTTLLKLILHFLRPTQGAVHTATSSIGYVPQKSSSDPLFPISVLEVVSLGLLHHKQWKKPAYEALEKVGLTHLADHPFSHCSGGQIQRILIARALASDPKLLLLDEPTANLDLTASDDILTLLRPLDITIIMVSHDLQTVINEVDRVLCVQGTVTTSMPEEICQHFAMGLYHKPLINGNEP